MFLSQFPVKYNLIPKCFKEAKRDEAGVTAASTQAEGWLFLWLMCFSYKVLIVAAETPQNSESVSSKYKPLCNKNMLHDIL